MSKTVSRRLSIGLAIFGLVSTILMLILFCANKGFIIDLGEGSLGGTTYAALFTLGFGGPWYISGEANPINYGGNALMAIAFIFVVIANILAIVLLYSIAAKKFLPKTNRILSITTFCLLLSATIVACCTKIIAISVCKETAISNYIRLSANTIINIVFGFLAVVSYIGVTAIPFIKQKEQSN